MADLIAELIKDTIDEDLNSKSEEIISQKRRAVLADITYLKDIKRELKTRNLLAKKEISRSSQLATLLGKDGWSFQTQQIQNISNQTIIVQKILEAYHLTSKILFQLGLNPRIKYVVTYQEEVGGKIDFYRLEDFEFTSNEVLPEIRKKDTAQAYLKLRVKSSAIKKQLAEQNAQVVALKEHFNDFIQPFKEAEISSSKRRKYKFKMQAGYAAEAFERHLEEIKHQLPNGKNPSYPPYSSEITKNPIGHAWFLYWQSMGNAPYYTGPDTLQSQIKNDNASLIDNVNTVLNTLEVLIQMVDMEISPEAVESVKAQYKKAFSVQNPKTNKISEKILKNIDANIRKQLQDEIDAIKF